MKKENLIIRQALNLIEEQCGLKLQLCDYFTGLKSNANGYYFNVILSKRVSEAREFVILESFSKKYGFIKIEPNGLNRIAIFPRIH